MTDIALINHYVQCINYHWNYLYGGNSVCLVLKFSFTHNLHVDISDGKVEPALVVAAGGDGVELPACPPECGRVVGDDGAAPAPVRSLEVAGHVTGEGEAAAQPDGLLRLPEDDPGGAGEVPHGWQHNKLVPGGAQFSPSVPSEKSEQLAQLEQLEQSEE